MTKEEIKEKLRFCIFNKSIKYIKINDYIFYKSSGFHIEEDYFGRDIIIYDRNGFAIATIAYDDIRSIE